MSAEARRVVGLGGGEYARRAAGESTELPELPAEDEGAADRSLITVGRSLVGRSLLEGV